MIRTVVLPDDLPAILLLEQTLFPENYIGEVLLRGEIEVGLAWVIGQPAYAYALVRTDGSLVDLTRLGVLPEWQGCGLGHKLLDKVLGLGKETMLTVSKINQRALALYLRYGFRIVAHHPAAWVMRRPRYSTRTEYSTPQAHR